MVEDNPDLVKPKGHISKSITISTTSDNTIIISAKTNSGQESHMELEEDDAREIARRVITHCDIINPPK